MYIRNPGHMTKMAAVGLNINDSEKKLDPRDSCAPTLGQYTCLSPKYSNVFSSETARPIKAKFYVKHQ